MFKMSNLERCFNTAKERDQKFVGVLVQMDGFSKPEVIINPIENADAKLEYYKKTYDDDLNHKFASGIKIVGFSYGLDFLDIEIELIEYED